MSTPSNPFEAGTRKVIPAVLIYARARFDDGERILMIHRVSGKTSSGAPDYHAGKWNGLGGKSELDESPWETARRELREESGLDLPGERFNSLGVLQFPNFKAHKNEDWLVFVFEAHVTPQELALVQPECPEGRLHWIPTADLVSLNLWPGDRHFIPFVQAGKPMLGTLWYDGQELRRHQVVKLKT